MNNQQINRPSVYNPGTLNYQQILKNNPRIPYGIPPSDTPKGEVSNKTVIIVFSILAVFIIIWIIINFYFYSKDKLWFSVYKPKKGPANAVYPNGLPTSSGGTVAPLSATILANKNKNLAAYQASNYNNENEWGPLQKQIPNP